MGLRWAPHPVDLNHASQLDSEHIIRGRSQSINDYVFDKASRKVDEILKLDSVHNREHYRPDLHHRQRAPSPYHPGGYDYEGTRIEGEKVGPPVDPNGRGFERIDLRPSEMQQPPYERYRHRPVQQERIEPGPLWPPQIGPGTPTPEIPQGPNLPEVAPGQAPQEIGPGALSRGSLSTPHGERSGASVSQGASLRIRTTAAENRSAY